jgi:pepF/M3 family oligoendopeptidase
LDTTWSLKELYDSFESPVFVNDMENAAKAIADFGKWAASNLNSTENEKEKIEKAIQIQLDMEKYNKLISFAHLSISTNADDVLANKYSDRIKEMYSNMTDPLVMFEKYVIQCEKLDEYIESSEILKAHEFYLKQIKENGKYLLSENEEIIISKLKITGSNAWELMKEQVLANISVDFELDGEVKKLTLPMLRNLYHHADKDVRKRAYYAELEASKDVEKPVCAALNAIKGEVITMANRRSYDSPLDMTLKNSRMDRETLDAMLSAIKEYLPVFHKFYKKKAELMGIEGGLPFFDITAPIGKVSMTYTYEEAADYVVKNFNDFSEELGTFARNAFDNRWIDAYPRKGKRGGAFCSGIHAIGQCRILANYNGSFDSMLTFAHELGHGFHGYCLKDETMLNSTYTMPIAETASTFCETLVANAALKTATPEEAVVIMENEIMGCSQVVVDIYSRFLFEDELFRRRANGSLSPDELKEIMIDSQKKAYGDGLNHEFLHPYMWVNKVHYYYASRNYYNFPYAYGQLFALGLYGIYKKEGSDFIPKYKAMLGATGKKNLVDIGLMMGINVRDKKFWESSLQVMADEIEEFCKISL